MAHGIRFMAQGIGILPILYNVFNHNPEKAYSIQQKTALFFSLSHLLVNIANCDIIVTTTV
jgi:hypothetical protein